MVRVLLTLIAWDHRRGIARLVMTLGLMTVALAFGVAVWATVRVG